MPKEKKSVIQTGALIRPPHHEDRVAGEGGLDIADRMLDYNWFKYKSLGEWQYDIIYRYDTKSCVSFAGNNDIEIQLNYLLAKKLLPQRTVDFLYKYPFIKDGKIKLSNRYTAIKSGTTDEGNYFTAVGGFFRKGGAIPEAMFPFGGKNFAEYHDPKNITAEMDAVAAEFLTHFVIRYGWVVAIGRAPFKFVDQQEHMFKEIRKAPLQRLSHGHSTIFYAGIHKQKWLELDHYKPFDREKPWDFNPPYVGMILIEPISEFTEAEIKTAKARVVKIILEAHKVNKIFRPETHNGAKGEAYWIDFDGSLHYETAKGTMFKRMIENKEIIPISEVEWQKMKAAEIK